MTNRLTKYRKIWQEKKILRESYIPWYKKIISDLSINSGKTLEIGSGTGNFKEYKKDLITSDIEKCSWLDMSFDAHKMPFKNHSLANIVMVDVLHHLKDPILFLNEADRVLKKGGRVIMIEPFPSLFSLPVYRKFHPEPFIMNVDYFNLRRQKGKKDPWDSNQAIPYLLFFKNRQKTEKIFSKKLRLLKVEKLSFIVYPLSGGFENKSMVPDLLIPFLKLLEIILKPLRDFISFRCYIVLERL